MLAMSICTFEARLDRDFYSEWVREFLSDNYGVGERIFSGTGHVLSTRCTEHPNRIHGLMGDKLLKSTGLHHHFRYERHPTRVGCLQPCTPRA